MSTPTMVSRIVGASAPPLGQTANFINPPNHNTQLIVLHTICLTLITLFVGIRVCTRVFVLRQFGWDDGKSAIR